MKKLKIILLVGVMPLIANAMIKDEDKTYAQFIIADFLTHHNQENNNEWHRNEQTHCWEHCCSYNIKSALNVYESLLKIKLEEFTE